VSSCTNGDADSDAQTALHVGMALAALTTTELWLTHVTIGGSLTEAQVGRELGGRATRVHDELADAVNDHLMGTDLAYRVPYLSELRPLLS